jgi:uncharacterized protein YdbL (DUF1318 family)
MKRFLITALVLISLIAAVSPVHAQDLNAIKARMEQRLPSLDALRKKGAIGENNRGLTEVRQNVDNASAVASAENSDREAVYAAIAKQQGGVSAEQVGRARARQIAANSAAGVWLQRDSGEWYQK